VQGKMDVVKINGYDDDDDDDDDDSGSKPLKVYKSCTILNIKFQKFSRG
jgi:hypothetical protein